ncbi:MAG: conjugative transposon protein TraK [Sphingobacteriales bacterium]|nr:conjugative transposon protein TraK [Sphingobacteriales bacterium]
MFQKAKGIDTAFRSVRRFALFFMGGCLLLTLAIGYQSYRLASDAQQRIYILANGKALEAFAADRKENIPVEARDHVKVFHQNFFTLDPDEKVIQSGITRALYMADRSAKEQYDNLKENGYYANLISGNISQDIEADSILINIESYPFYFRYKGVQRIIRPTTLTTRSLVTEGYLRYVTRSDHNPHGFLIEHWRTLDNKDLEVKER